MLSSGTDVRSQLDGLRERADGRAELAQHAFGNAAAEQGGGHRLGVRRILFIELLDNFLGFVVGRLIGGLLCGRIFLRSLPEFDDRRRHAVR